MKYKGHYDLDAVLSQQANLIGSHPLYNVGDAQIYAAIMDRLARPLPNGEASPFSSQAPGSAHSILVGAIAHMLGLFGHDLNLYPDATWVYWFRLLGAELYAAEYPVITLTFYRTQAAINQGLPAIIPLGTQVRSQDDPTLAALTQQQATIDGAAPSANVPARLNRLGRAPNLRPGEFSLTPPISFIDSVANDGTILSEGREAETLPEAMLRIREGIRTGNLARFATDAQVDVTAERFYGRCVTPRDFLHYARLLGATQVRVIPRQHSPGVSDAVTVALYPPEQADAVGAQLIEMTLDEQQLLIRPAQVIPLDGTIGVRAVAGLSPFEVRNRAAIAISEQLNPPHGSWADPHFSHSLATVLEQVEGIYAVPEMQLKHAVTGEALSDIRLQPWSLLEIQNSIEFEVSR